MQNLLVHVSELVNINAKKKSILHTKSIYWLLVCSNSVNILMHSHISSCPLMKKYLYLLWHQYLGKLGYLFVENECGKAVILGFLWWQWLVYFYFIAMRYVSTSVIVAKNWSESQFMVNVPALYLSLIFSLLLYF